MDSTDRAKTVLFASTTTAITFGLTVIGKGSTTDLAVSGFAALALLAGGLLLERAVVQAFRGTLTRADASIAGLLSGFPLSFFMVQTMVAGDSGNASLSAGAERVVSTIGVILVVVAAGGAWRRRKDQRM